MKIFWTADSLNTFITSFSSEFHEGIELKATKEMFLLQSARQLWNCSHQALCWGVSPVWSAISFFKFYPALFPSSVFSPISHLASWSASICPVENHHPILFRAPGLCLTLLLFLPVISAFCKLFLHASCNFFLILLCIHFPAAFFCCLLCIRPNNSGTV